MSQLRQRFAWLQVICLCWLVLLSFSSVKKMLPPSFWLEVQRFNVADSYVGESPVVQVIRTIHRPFTGDWIIQLEKQSGDKFIDHCTAYGRSYYSPEQVLPEVMTMDRWLAASRRKCDYSAGFYRITSVWRIHVDSASDKEIIYFSNIFRISEKPLTVE